MAASSDDVSIVGAEVGVVRQHDVLLLLDGLSHQKNHSLDNTCNGQCGPLGKLGVVAYRLSAAGDDNSLGADWHIALRLPQYVVAAASGSRMVRTAYAESGTELNLDALHAVRSEGGAIYLTGNAVIVSIDGGIVWRCIVVLASDDRVVQFSSSSSGLVVLQTRGGDVLFGTRHYSTLVRLAHTDASTRYGSFQHGFSQLHLTFNYYILVIITNMSQHTVNS